MSGNDALPPLAAAPSAPWQQTFYPEPAAAPAPTAPPVAATPHTATAFSAPVAPPVHMSAYGGADAGVVSRFGGPPQPPGGWGYSTAPALPAPRAIPSRAVYAGRWARARGILGVLFSAAFLVPIVLSGTTSARRPQSIAGVTTSSSIRSTPQLDDSTVVLLILLFVALFGLYLFWLVAGHRTIHGSRSAATVVFVLSVADLVLMVVLLAFSATSVGSALLGSALSVVIIGLLMDRESAAWRKGR